MTINSHTNLKLQYYSKAVSQTCSLLDATVDNGGRSMKRVGRLKCRVGLHSNPACTVCPLHTARKISSLSFFKRVRDHSHGVCELVYWKYSNACRK